MVACTSLKAKDDPPIPSITVNAHCIDLRLDSLNQLLIRCNAREQKIVTFGSRPPHSYNTILALGDAGAHETLNRA